MQFFEAARRPGAQYRNAVVVAPAGLDRSPCGTGTSARMANLHARGRLAVGEPFGHESILGTLFSGRIVEVADVAGTPAVIPEITGRAFMIGRGTLVLDPRDPFPAGFLSSWSVPGGVIDAEDGRGSRRRTLTGAGAESVSWYAMGRPAARVVMTLSRSLARWSAATAPAVLPAA